jgi:hypothetical protein
LNTMLNKDLPKKIKSYVVEAFKFIQRHDPPQKGLDGMSSPQPNGLDRWGAIT